MGLECDIIQSRDATIYLAHDTLYDGIVHYELKAHLREQDRETLGNRFIYQVPDKDVQKLKLKDGQDIPRLRSLFQIMKHYPGRILNLELKGPNTADIAVRTVERAIQEELITPQQILFSSFNLPSLRDLRINAGHRFKIGALLTLNDLPMTQMFPNWPNAPQDAVYVPFVLEDGVLDRTDLREIEPDYLNLEHKSVTMRAVDEISEKFPNTKIILWTAGEPHPDDNPSVIDIVKQLAPTGKLYAVITDFPQELQDHLIKAGIKIKTP